MIKTELMAKYLAWMELFDKTYQDEWIENRLNEKGERTVEGYLPLIDKTISATHKDIEEAYALFFVEASNSIDEFIKYDTDTSRKLESKINELNEKRIKEMEEHRNKKREKTEYSSLVNNITNSRFNKDLNESIDIINKTISDVALTLDEKASNLYIRIIPKAFFDSSFGDNQVIHEAQALVYKEVRDSNMLLLFTKCRVLSDSVIVIGVTEKL